MKIAFVRTASNILRYGGYNIQEIGLAKALMPYGVSTDVYARFSNIDVITEKSINALWRLNRCLCSIFQH